MKAIYINKFKGNHFPAQNVIILQDEYQSKSVRTIKLSTLNRTSKFTFTPISTGIVICEARNSQGRSETRAKIILNDLNETLSVWSAYTLPILVGDDISIICGASNQKYSSELNWYKDNIRIVNADSKYINLKIYR